jgi:predicted kinase
MSTPPPSRSVKISDDERLGWSSDRPRRDGAPARPADISTRCRILQPSDRLRYSPGSLLVIVSASATARDAFVERVIQERAAVLSLAKVRGLLAGRVGPEEVETRGAELLHAAASKRIDSGETVVLVAETLDAAEREPYVRMAAAHKRPRHIMLLETARDDVPEEARAALNALRKELDAGDLGAEGFQTALRLGGGTVSEVKRILFRPPPQDD